MKRRFCLNLFGMAFLLAVIIPAASAQAPFFTGSSPRSMALGGVGSTGFDEPSAMHLNPAGLMDIERFSLNAGLASTYLDGTVDADETSSSTDDAFTIMPGVSGAVNLGSRLVAAGFSLNTFDYQHVSFPADAVNRYQGTEMLLYSGGFDAALGFMPIRNWAFGFKVGYMAAHAEWNRTLNPFPENPDPSVDIDVRMDMNSTTDWNALLGVIWSPSYRFEAGLTYRPPLAYHFEPDIEVKLPEILGGTTLGSGAKELRVEIPQEIRLGFHWLASERIDLYLDAGWTNYGSLDDMEITAEDPKAPFIFEKLKIPVDMDDVWHGHVGLEYLASGLLTLRFGGFYYSAGGNEAYELSLFPQGERYGFTAGLGIHLFEWDIDLAGGQSILETRRVTGSETPFPLTAETDYTNTFGAVSVRYRF